MESKRIYQASAIYSSIIIIIIIIRLNLKDKYACSCHLILPSVKKYVIYLSTPKFEESYQVSPPT